MNKQQIKKDFFFLFLIVGIIVFFSESFVDEIKTLPKGIHSWKQSMHFAMTKNFYENNDKLYYPSLDNLFNSDNSGHLIQEFPILNYIASFFFPKYPYALRVINFILLILGMYVLYRFTLKIVNDYFLSVLISINTLIIPIVFYYGISYLTDVSAMFLGIISVYVFQIYLENNKNYYLIVSFILLTLSGLMRLPVIIFPIAFFLTILVRNFNLRLILPFFLSLIIIGLWHYYVLKYNHYYISKPSELCYFNLDEKTRNTTMLSISSFIKFQIGYTNAFVFYYIIVIFLIIIFKKFFEKKFYIYFYLTGILSLIYLILWFGIFNEHDYYLIPIIPFTVLALVSLAISLNNINSTISKFIFILITIYNSLYSIDNIRWRFFQSRFEHPFKLMDKYEEGLHWWYEYEDNIKWKSIRFISPYYGSNILFKHGIRYNDTVICTFDPSPSYVLSLLKLKGWTNYNNDWHDLNDIINKTKMGAKYIITYGHEKITNNPSNDSILRKNIVLKIDSICIYNIEHIKNFQLSP